MKAPAFNNDSEDRVYKMTALEKQIKRKVEQALEELPADKMAEVLDFVLFLKNRCGEEEFQGTANRDSGMLTVQTMPASHLDRLTGLVEWGGDAFTDSERLYNDSF
jgi:hypothetical protein